jgi:PTH1 family peptidyl-tRNA hydrolase
MLTRNSGISWLVVFLGNPGPKYAGTRHNAGFLAADALSRSQNLPINRLRFRALTGKWEVDGQSVLLMKPQTYMNNSGESVGQAARFYKVPADHVLVVSDDISLPCGKLRIRTKGSAGGHNGLKASLPIWAPMPFPG